MKRLAAAAAATALLAAGCGGGASEQAGASKRPTTTTSTAPAGDAGAPADPGTATTEPGAATRTDGGQAVGPTTTTTASGTQGPAPPAPATNVELHRDCVVRGSASDLQGFTADVPSGAIVIYSTEYSDRSNEVSNPEYATGFGDTRAVGDDGASATWVVPAQAPVGTATLHVAGSVDIHPRELHFEVVSDEEDCG